MEVSDRSEPYWFGTFQFDPSRRLLSHAGGEIGLRPKTLDVLLLLLQRAGEVVSKDEILAQVWHGNAVSEYVLTTCISELRGALGDRRTRPQYVATLHGSGYRFVAEVRRGPAATPRPSRGGSRPDAIVGRETQLSWLSAAAQRARAGERQIVFITGEMGIGKTTLADEFLRRLGSDAAAADLIARGQCIEQFGAGEPYMPLFEAIGRLGREEDDAVVVDVLRRRAPGWLSRIPGLLTAEQRHALRLELPTETQEHMLRLIADGIEALSETRLLVLLLEDLHLSDHATLELIATLALRRGPARLLLLGTFRSAEDFPASSPFQRLKQQLLLHRQSDEIALAPLRREEIAYYLTARFAGLVLPHGLADSIHARTEGNPLFSGRLVDQLLEDSVLRIDNATNQLLLTADIGSLVPQTLRAMIEQRTDSLTADEREVVETASVAGVTFWSSSLATATGRGREEVELVCDRMSRRDGLLAIGEGADATLPDLGARYGFRHALYQQVLYERIGASRRQRLHAALGNALRATWAARAGEVAAELASHFERGGDRSGAVEFYDKAAAAAAGQGASREAVVYLDRGLALLALDPDDSDRRERQLDLLMSRGPSLLAAAGHGSADALGNYQRALELSRQLGNRMRELTCLAALAVCQQTRGHLREGEEIARALVSVAEQIGLPAPIIAQLHNPLSQALMYRGAVEESLALSEAAVRALAVFSMPPPTPDNRPALWADAGVLLHSQLAAVSFARGRLAQAGSAVGTAVQIARELKHPFNLGYALCWAALYENTMGRWDTAIQVAQESVEITHTYGFPLWEGIGKVVAGHALARRGDVAGGEAQLRAGIELCRSTGARLAVGLYLNLLADVCLLADDVAAAQAALSEAEAHVAATEERVFLPETHRLRAECRRRLGAGSEGSRRDPAASDRDLAGAGHQTMGAALDTGTASGPAESPDSSSPG